MNSSLTYIFSTAFLIILLNLRGSDAYLPSQFISREDNSTSNETTISDQKFQTVHKKALDLIWLMKCYIFEAREQYRRLRIMDGTEIEFLQELFDDLHSYLNVLGDIVARVVEKHLRVEHWDRITPLNQTIMEKLSEDWTEIKGHVDAHKPKTAIMEYDSLCKAINGAIEDLPKQYKPIYDLVMELQNETQLSEAEEAQMKEQTTVISVIF